MKNLILILMLHSLVMEVFSQDLKIIHRNGHAFPILKMEISIGGSHLASQSTDGTVIVHDLNSEKIIYYRKLERKLIGITSDNRFVLANTNDTIFALDPLQGKMDPIDSSMIHRKSKKINAYYYEEGINLGDGHILNSRFSDKYFTCLDEVDSMVVAGDEDGRIVVKKSKSVYKIDAHIAKISAICISPDKRIFASTGEDHAIIIWNINELSIKSILENNNVSIGSMNLDGQRIMVGDRNGNVYVLKDLFSIPVFNHFKLGESPVNDILFTSEKKYLFATDKNKLVETDTNFRNVREFKVTKKKRGYRLKSWYYEKMNFYHEPFTSVYSLEESYGEVYIDYFHKVNHRQNRSMKNMKVTHSFEYGSLYEFTPDKFHHNYFETNQRAITVSFYKEKQVNQINYFLPESIHANSMFNQRNALSEKIIFDSVYTYIAVRDKIHVFERWSGKKLWTMDSIAKSDITGLKKYKEDILLISTLDGTIRFIDAKTSKIKLSVLIFEEGFMMIDPSGFYYSNIKNIDDYVTFIYKGKLMTSNQLEFNFNRPEIVLKEFPEATEFTEIYKKIRESKSKSGWIHRQEDYLTEAPICNWKNSDSLTFGSIVREIGLECTVDDPKDGSLDYFLSNNGVFISIANDELTKSDKGRTNIKKRISLLNGKNEIQFFVRNSSGLYSNVLTKTIMFHEEKSLTGNLFYIGIGVSEYEQGNFNLTYASKDIIDLSKELESKTGYFKKKSIYTFINGQVNVSMCDSIKKILKKVKVGDALIIHYAGHGIIGEDFGYYLALHNTDFINPTRNSFKLDSLTEMVKRTDGYLKTIILDACHSGEIDEDSKLVANDLKSEKVKFRSSPSTVKSTINLNERMYKQYLKEIIQTNISATGANILSGSSGYELSMESDRWKNGLFTYALLEGLRVKAADDDKDGSLTVEEWQKYSGTRVAELSNGKQNPESRELNKKISFIIK